MLISDVISRLFAGRLFHSWGVAVWNVDRMRPLGWSKNNEEFDVRD